MIDTAIFASSGAPSPYGGGGINDYYGVGLGSACVGGTQLDAAPGERFFAIDAQGGVQLADGFYIITARMLAHAVWTAPGRPDPRSLVLDTRLSLDDLFTGGGGTF